MSALSDAVCGPALIKLYTEIRRTTRDYPPTDTHRFIAGLNASGKLVRNYSQNIDDIERRSGLPAPKCILLHGSLRSLRCLSCHQRFEWTEDEEAVTMTGWLPVCPSCPRRSGKGQELRPGYVRPDILLYDEDDGRSSETLTFIKHDLSLGVNLLLVLGTSLTVGGSKNVVKDFARRVRSSGEIVFVNLTEVSKSAWDGIIDF